VRKVAECRLVVVGLAACQVTIQAVVHVAAMAAAAL